MLMNFSAISESLKGKMKNKLILLVVAVMLLSVATMSAAYDIEIIPAGSLDAKGQNNIFFDIIFNSDPDGNTLKGYSFQLLYDNTELTRDSGSGKDNVPEK